MGIRKLSDITNLSKNVQDKNLLSKVETAEKTSIRKANETISVIENLIAVWDASKAKPKELKQYIDHLRYLHETLSTWVRKMIMSKKRTESLETRIERLREFSDICYVYSKWSYGRKART